MILVTLGTQDISFVRLLEALEKQTDLMNCQERIVVQAGSTVFQSKKMELFDLIPMAEFDALLAQCDLLITHGGVGTIMAALKLGKKIIAVPRLAKYHEHHNDHQLEIISSFSKEGYLLGCVELDQLPEVLQQVKNFQPRSVASNTNNMIQLISNYIEETC